MLPGEATGRGRRPRRLRAPSIRSREDPHGHLLALLPHQSRLHPIRLREDIQRQFGRSFASLACPSRSLLSALYLQRRVRPNRCGRDYRAIRARPGPREFAFRPCPRTYGGAVDEWLTAGLAGDRGGGQPPGSVPPGGCRSLPRTARRFCCRTPRTAGRLLMATGRTCHRHG